MRVFHSTSQERLTSDTNLSASYDPYQSLAQGLKLGDAVNGLLLLHPRRRIAQLLKGQRVLDVCCGTGNLTAMLVAVGCQAVGVDSSPTMLSYAQRKRIAAEFQLMDATCLPFNREFDAAVISIALHEMPPHVREKVWTSMRRAVRPQGRLIAIDYTVPRTTSLLARIMRSLVERDERSLLTIHREHYENFQEFMRNGGLRAWIQERSEAVETEYDFWGGTVAAVICRRFESD
ncbi:MAG: class I SAM-dependent methyltransferase [Chloroflexota bacterium]